MSFKDMEKFHLALLGKQVWRLLTKPDTLVAHVFKAQYFQHTTILNANLGARPSYAWRSLHDATKLIRLGARAVIGNGENTSLWEDPWIEEKPAKSLVSSRLVHSHQQNTLSGCSRVKDFLAPDGREWNIKLLRLVLSEEDIRKIQTIRP